jgi:hypothetical protein
MGAPHRESPANATRPAEGERRDSNPRPPGPQPGARPRRLSGHRLGPPSRHAGRSELPPIPQNRRAPWRATVGRPRRHAWFRGSLVVRAPVGKSWESSTPKLGAHRRRLTHHRHRRTPRNAGVSRWAGVGSNHRPTDYESAALTAELPARCWDGIAAGGVASVQQRSIHCPELELCPPRAQRQA